MQKRIYRQRATYADLVAAPPHLVAELIGGELVTHPRPVPRHSNASTILATLINGPFQLGNSGPGGWWILSEPEIHMDGDVTVPDIAGWRRDRLPKLPKTAFFELPPDWLCELLSPATRRYDRGEKRDIYARHGVRHLWFVEPDDKLLEAYELSGDHWTLLRTFKDNDQVAAPPFEAAPFALGLLWAD